MDASTSCFNGWHAPLALLAIGVLVCLTCIPAVVIFTQKIQVIINIVDLTRLDKL